MKRALLPFILLGFIISFTSCGNSKQTDEQKPDSVLVSKAVSSLPALLTDFETRGNRLNPPYSGDIYAYTDENENPKGTSTINELIRNADGTAGLNLMFEKEKGVNNSDRFLKISGNITATFPFGFAGCGVNFINDRKPLDISQFKGIKFWAKGTTDNYIIRIESPAIKDYSFHECRFFVSGEWEEFVINFDNFRQPSWKSTVVNLDDVLKSAIGFQWQTNSRPINNYFLCLDNIEFIK